MQKRRKSSRRRTYVRQRRFSAVEKRIIITLEKSDRISSAFIVFVPNKSLIIALIRFFRSALFSILGMYFIISAAQGFLSVRMHLSRILRTCYLLRLYSQQLFPLSRLLLGTKHLLIFALPLEARGCGGAWRPQYALRQ